MKPTTPFLAASFAPVLFAIAVGPALLAANVADAHEQEARALLEQVRKAALKSDAAFFESYFADGLSRIEARGQLDSKEDALHAFKSGDVRYHSLESRDMQIHLYGDTAIVTLIYDFSATRKGNGFKGSNRVTRVLERCDGRWQEVAFQATPIGD
jgi:uncharacterized protein (TIGR02246 family)